MSRLADYFVVVGYDYNKERKLNTVVPLQPPGGRHHPLIVVDTVLGMSGFLMEEGGRVA